MFYLLLLIFSMLYIDRSANGLFIKFKDVFPGYASGCFMSDKLLFGMSCVILLLVKI